MARVGFNPEMDSVTVAMSGSLEDLKEQVRDYSPWR